MSKIDHFGVIRDREQTGTSIDRDNFLFRRTLCRVQSCIWGYILFDVVDVNDVDVFDGCD